MLMACNGPISEVKILSNPSSRLAHQKKQIESQHVDNFVSEEMVELAVDGELEEGVDGELEEESMVDEVDEVFINVNIECH